MTSAGAAESAAIGVLVFPHPFSQDCRRHSEPAGQTILEILGDDLGPLLVLADGRVVDTADWGAVVPRRQLIVRRIPQGDAGRLLGSIAILALSIYTGGAVGAAYGASWGAAAAAGVSIAGNLALNALVPPALPSLGGGGAVRTLSSITGVNNQIGEFTPIPRLYGFRQYYPPIPMTGLPYTELVGEDQYIRMLVVLGYGPLDIGGVRVGAGEAILDENTSLTGTPIKIGGTSIDQFEDVEFEIGDPDDVTLYTDSVTETAVNVALNPTAAPTTENQLINDNVQVTQTTQADTDEVILEVFFPLLFTASGQGNTRNCRVNFEVHRSPVGAGTWTLATSFTVQSNERKQIRRGVRIVMPTAGQYDIRLTRVSTFYVQENDHYSDCTWTVIRSIARDVRAFDVDNTVVMALRIRASDQLGGRVDRLSVEATAVLPVWNGSAWADEATRSPAWAYADIFTGAATKRPAPQSRVEADDLLDWADWCETEGLTFDHVFDQDGTVLQRGRDAASAGLASWHVSSTGNISIVYDVVEPSEVMISPRSSAQFSMDYTFSDLPHALKVKFTDPDRWEDTERIVYADGYDENNATKFESIPTIGVTDPDQAWKVGRFHLAQMILRPEIYSWTDDVRHLLYRRGQTLDLAHDVISVGLQWGRVLEVYADSSDNVTGAVIDEYLLMESGPSYGCRIQYRDGSIDTEEIIPVVPGSSVITFATPIAPVDYGSGAEPALTVGDQFLFGVLGQEYIQAKITRIEPRGDFKAQITAVPAAPDIYDGWDSGIPTFDPVITQSINVDLLPPTLPTIVNISSESPPSASGAPRTRMVVAFNLPPGLVGVNVEARVRTKEVISSVDVFSDWRIEAPVPSSAGVLYVTEVEEQITYQVQLRARRGDRLSSWTSTGEHTIGDSGWLSEPGATAGADWNINIGGQVFESDDFGDGNLEQWRARWSEIVTAGDSQSTHFEAGAYGGVTWRNGDNSGNDEVWRGIDRRRARTLVDGRLYRIYARVRRWAGAGTIYIGVNGFKGSVRAGAGAAVNTAGADSLSSQHYFAANSYDPGDANWHFVEGYFRKGAAAAYRAGTPEDPHVCHPDVEYVAPMFLGNYNSLPGAFDIDIIGLEEMDLRAVSAPDVGGNLIVDPNFTLQYADKGTTLVPTNGPVAANFRYWGASTSTWALNATAGEHSGIAARLAANTNGTLIASRFIPASNAERFFMSLRVNFGSGYNGTLSVNMYVYDVNRSLLATVTMNAISSPTTGAWLSANYSGVIASANARFVRFGLAAASGTAGTITVQSLQASRQPFPTSTDDMTVAIVVSPGRQSWVHTGTGWSPADGSGTVDLDIIFVARRGATVIATLVLRGVLDDAGGGGGGEGDITVSTFSGGTGWTIDYDSTNGTPFVVATVTHDASGAGAAGIWNSTLPGESGVSK